MFECEVLVIKVPSIDTTDTTAITLDIISPYMRAKGTLKEHEVEKQAANPDSDKCLTTQEPVE